MSEFIGPEADAWQSKLAKQYELLRMEATYDIGQLALWRCLEELRIWRDYLVDNDPNYHENLSVYNHIITSGFTPAEGKHRKHNGIPE